MSREGFLDRWSRVKREAEAEPLVEEPEVAEPPAPVEDDRPDDEILAELGLPNPADLKPGDDIKGFMQAAVPDRLRRLALRQLWRSNPVLANVDGLVEYGEDYTDAATIVENMQTVYQVGKGMVRDIIGDDEEEEEESLEEAVVADTETSEPPAQENEAGEPEALETEPIAEVEQALPPAEDVADIGPTTRRMSFRFAN